MNNFISNLYDYICEQTPSLRDDPEYQQVVKAYREIEAEVQEKIGEDLLSKYQYAEGAYSHLWALAVFRQSLRLSCRFMLEMLR